MNKPTLNEPIIETILSRFTEVRDELHRLIIGQTDRIEELLVCLAGRGHVLIEGVPGLGKTYIVKCLGSALGLDTGRVQFTPDLMPADIIGTNLISVAEGGVKRFSFQRGPVFTNLLLADEINRASPKTQSALLEAMQELQVTAAGETLLLPPPFMVLATQNPIEMEGTYPLPEAQLDRFFFKSVILPPSREELHRILDLTTGEIPVPRAAATREDVLKLQEIIRILPIARQVQDYAVRIVAATHNPGGHELGRYIRYGASPRGAQSLVLGGKGFAFLAGRNAVSYEDIRRAALPALRHRLILSFEAEAEGIEPDTVISTLIGEIPE